MSSESPPSPPNTQLHDKPDISSESPPSTPKTRLKDSPDLLRDLMLWRRKQLNIFVLFVATAAWVVMEIYQYNFITLLSWAAMIFLACLFFWGKIHRLLKKEAPDLPAIEISEETAMEAASTLRQWVQEGVRFMFHVSVEREWFVFVGVVASLYLLSLVASHLDSITLCCIGVVGGMILPVLYVKNEHKIRQCAEKLRMKSRSLYVMIEDKLQKMKSKIAGRSKEIKVKKTE